MRGLLRGRMLADCVTIFCCAGERSRVVTPLAKLNREGGATRRKRRLSPFVTQRDEKDACPLFYAARGRTGASFKRGAAASLGESSGSFTGHSIPTSGSFHTTERSVPGA
jgi:hypothetical protein